MTSSSYAGSSSNAWNVNFNNGNTNNNNKTNSFFVRAVRSGKCSLLSFDSVYQAYLNCRQRKRGTVNTLRFEYNLIDNLIALASELQTGRYRPSQSICFVNRQPKLREVFAADFRDRVVHHLVVPELEKYWEVRFIHDSYANRKGKGTHAAVHRLSQFMCKLTCNGKRTAYFIQLDIKSFFMSIDKQILYSMLAKHIDMPELARLVEIIIFHDCTQNYHFKGNPAIIDRIPPHKSLFKVGPLKGIPIGNLSSQFFANIYLHPLDQFAKHVLKCSSYIRYVDDFILLSQDPEQLIQWRNLIVTFLTQKLTLQLKEPGKVKPVSQGADFLGYIVRPDYRLVRRRVVNNFKYRLALLREKIVLEQKFENQCFYLIQIAGETIEELRAVLASYFGHFKHAGTYRLKHLIFQHNPWLTAIFNPEDCYAGRFRMRWYNRRMHHYRYFKTQARFFKKRLPQYILFFVLGRYIECFDGHATVLADLAGLKISTQQIRGMQKRAGFRKYKFPIFVRKVLAAGYGAVLIEEGQRGLHLRERFVKEIYCTGNSLFMINY